MATVTSKAQSASASAVCVTSSCKTRRPPEASSGDAARKLRHLQLDSGRIWPDIAELHTEIALSNEVSGRGGHKGKGNAVVGFKLPDTDVKLQRAQRYPIWKD